MKIVNTRPNWGHPGPFEATSVVALMDVLMPTIKDWAEEMFLEPENINFTLAEIIQRIRREFIEGLVEVK